MNAPRAQETDPSRRTSGLPPLAGGFPTGRRRNANVIGPDDLLDDEHLLFARLAAGDRRAAEELIESSYAQVYAALCRLTGDGSLADDLTQETYRKAWQSLPRFDRRSRFATWLYRIAYNTFLNHIRRPRRLQPLEERQVDAVRDPAPGQVERLERRETAARLRRAVLALPEELRFTVTARFWGDLEVAEIAHLEEVTGAAIRKRLKKAMALIETLLGEDLP